MKLRGAGRWRGRLVGLFGAAAVLVVGLFVRSPEARAVSCDTSWNGSTADWNVPGDWSTGVPSSTSNACIPSGTVTIASEGVVAGTLTISSGAALDLQVGGSNAVLTLSGSMTNAGTIDMIGGCCGSGAAISGTYAVGDQIVVPSGSTLTNTGTIETTGCCQANMELTGNVTNNGTLTVGHGLFNSSVGTLLLDGAATFDNKGAVSVGDGRALMVVGGAGYEFVNDTGGSIDNSGNGTSLSGVPANELFVGGGNTFTEGAGTSSHNPVLLNGDSDTLHFTGSGASSFLLHGADTLSGSTIAAGQTVSLQVDGDAVLTLSGSMTNAGTIDMIGGCCGGGTAIPGTYAVGDQIVVPSGSTLTNDGSIETTGCCQANMELTGNVTNDTNGTLALANGLFNSSVGTLLLDGAATFDNKGTVLVNDGHLLMVAGDTVIAELGGTINLNTSGRYSQDSASTLAVFVDAVHNAYSGISGGSGCSPCLSLAGTLRARTTGLPALGSVWPIIPGTTSPTTFGGTDFDFPYTVQYGSVTLVAGAGDSTATTPSSSSGAITALPGAGVTAGTTVYDAATVTGNSATQSPSGNVDFYVCDPATLSLHSATTCDSTIGAHLLPTETLPVGSGGPVTTFSSGQTVDSAGTWCFAAYYRGDSTFPASSDTSTGECFAVSAVQKGYTQLDPTATTCQQFAFAPTPSNLVGPIAYSLRSGKINSVSPGVFFSYSEFSASPGTAVDLRQSNDGPNQANGTSHWPNFQPTRGQVVVYDASCTVLSSRRFTETTITVGSDTNVQQIAVTIPSTASGSVFIVGIKFDSTSIDGTQPVTHTKPTVTYTFSTVIGATTESSAQLTLQPK